jgi:hypothetical protein
MSYAINQPQHRLQLAEVQLMLAYRTANNIALVRALEIKYLKLLHKLRLEDEHSFRNFVRTDPRIFHELHQRLEPRLSKKDTWFRKSIDPGLKLAVTLRHLASGDIHVTLSSPRCLILVPLLVTGVHF